MFIFLSMIEGLYLGVKALYFLFLFFWFWIYLHLQMVNGASVDSKSEIQSNTTELSLKSHR